MSRVPDMSPFRFDPPVGGWNQMDWRVFEESHRDYQALYASLSPVPAVPWERDFVHHFETVHLGKPRHFNCYEDTL
jgi:hypothetical protein